METIRAIAGDGEESGPSGDEGKMPEEKTRGKGEKSDNQIGDEIGEAQACRVR